jgi:hypothetical protein
MKALIIIICLLAGGNLYAQNVIQSIHADEIPLRDFDHASWEAAEFTQVSLLPQNIIEPTFTDPVVSHLQVKSIHNGELVAFKLEWEDESRDVRQSTTSHSDQVAIQMPLNPERPPSFMMGNQNGPVHIINWKAVWQEDIENGFQSIRDAWPNFWVDIYPMMEREGDGTTGKFAHDITAEEIALHPEARQFLAGTYAGNPMSIIIREEPSEEAVAEGFGTLTTLPEQHAQAWGQWEDGKWRVIIVRPIEQKNENMAPVSGESVMAFAVWDGGAGNQGGRKHYSHWVRFELQTE